MQVKLLIFAKLYFVSMRIRYFPGLTEIKLNP